MKTSLYLTVVLVFGFSIFGCAPMDSAVYDSTNRPPTTKVDIYKDGRTPERQYKIIGEVAMPGHRDDELLRQRQIVEKAKQMGGEGLIFTVSPSGQNALGVMEWLFKGKVIVYE
jgi:hypothetical protein